MEIKIAASFEGDLDMVELSDFNNQTGIISNPKKLTTTPAWAILTPATPQRGPQGVEFSPSGKHLYVSANYDVLWPCCPKYTSHDLLFQRRECKV